MGVVIAFAFFRKAGAPYPQRGGGCEGGGLAEAVGVVDGVGVGGEERGMASAARERSELCLLRAQLLIRSQATYNY